MRVLLLIKGLTPGGAERLLASASPYLDRERFAYEVAYVTAGRDALAPRLRAAGLPVTLLAGAAWPQALRRLVRTRGIQLVHAHSPLPAVAARLVLRGVTRVYTEHGVWTSYHPATRVANRMTLRAENHVFAVSDAVRATMRTGVRVETLWPGLDVAEAACWGDGARARAELGVPLGAPLVGAVGGLVAGKGHEHLLRAAAAVCSELPDARFVLVGDGPLAPRLRAQAHALGLNGAVLFAGYRNDAGRLACAFDVLAVPSEREALSVALLEAMAQGVPAVVAAAGGPQEVLGPERAGGRVVPVGDAAALARELTALLRDAPLRAQIGAAGRRRAAAFDIRRSVRRAEEVYAELLA